jgi:hypothetical protein
VRRSTLRWSRTASLVVRGHFTFRATVCQGTRVSSPSGEHYASGSPKRTQNLTTACCEDYRSRHFCSEWAIEGESVGRSVGQARILSPPNFPCTVTLRHDQDLAAPNHLVGVPFVSSQRAVEPHNRRIRADEGQLFDPFALNAIADTVLCTAA